MDHPGHAGVPRNLGAFFGLITSCPLSTRWVPSYLARDKTPSGFCCRGAGGRWVCPIRLSPRGTHLDGRPGLSPPCGRYWIRPRWAPPPPTQAVSLQSLLTLLTLDNPWVDERGWLLTWPQKAGICPLPHRMVGGGRSGTDPFFRGCLDAWPLPHSSTRNDLEMTEKGGGVDVRTQLGMKWYTDSPRSRQ